MKIMYVDGIESEDKNPWQNASRRAFGISAFTMKQRGRRRKSCSRNSL